MALTRIEQPIATAAVRWVSAQDGGRRSGPPATPVYVAPSAFVGVGEAGPRWPFDADPLLSILIERLSELPDGRELVRVGYLVPELARPHVRVGAQFVVVRARIEARGEFVEILDPAG